MRKTSLTDVQCTQQSRCPCQITHSVCSSCNFPKHLLWLNYQLWFLSLFTLYPNRLAVFTSSVIILPFIAAKMATSTGYCKDKHSCQFLKPSVFNFPYFCCNKVLRVTKHVHNNLKYLITNMYIGKLLFHLELNFTRGGGIMGYIVYNCRITTLPGNHIIHCRYMLLMLPTQTPRNHCWECFVWAIFISYGFIVVSSVMTTSHYDNIQIFSVCVCVCVCVCVVSVLL